MHDRGRLFFVGAALLTVVLYGQARDNRFLDDDYVFLRHVSAATSVTDLLRPDEDFAFYRPGTLCIFWLEHALFAEDSGKYLLFNYGIHVLNTFMFMLLMRRLSIGRTRALFAASLFLIGIGHYGKEVLWACTSGGLLAVTLSLMACWCVLDPDPRRGRIPMWMATGCMLLALTCHEAALVTPGLAALLLRSRGRRIRPALPLMGTALLWLAQLAVLRQVHPAYLQSMARSLAAPVILFRYPGFMFLPIQPEQLAAALPIQLGLASAVLVGALLLVHRANQLGGLLAAWLYAALLPYTLVGFPGWWLDMRYTYFAAMPFCALVVLTATHLLAASRRSIRVATAACLTLWICSTIAFEFHLERRCDEIARSSTVAPQGGEPSLSRGGSANISSKTR